MLEEMKEDFQGFFQGVRQVLRAREEGKLTDIEGAVIELIDVPKDYITAIETVLGGQAQHIVVESDQAARAAINWLKKTIADGQHFCRCSLSSRAFYQVKESRN